MVRALVRLVILLVVLVAGAAFLLGWWGNRRISDVERPGAAVGTTGVSPERARQVGAEVGERTAAAANEARRALADGQITAKIKAKMALDDTVKALDVNVDTTGTTLTGWDRQQTDRPTAFMMVTKFSAIIVLKGGQQRQLAQPLSAVQQRYLTALGVPPTCFITPTSG